jgi:cytochrome d ubiquinol oxidase subunit I
MSLDPFLLSRLQFALNITFHIIFPTLTIALGWFLVFLKLRYIKTKEQQWLDLYFLFTKIFALSFALGVVSGITMSFQFGTNWPGFMNAVGNIAGPLLAFEVLTAFFLEASFLGIMLYGIKRVPSWVHTGATVLVAIGTLVSAFWILALNSWMHTPVGFVMKDGVAHATNWFDIVFNPSMPYRLLHVVFSSALTTCFFVAGLGAWRILKADRSKAAFTSIKVAMIAAAFLAPAQLVVGDLHGINTAQHQPQKIAAMEGLWETTRGAPLVLFGIPDEERRENKWAIEIPMLSSLIITRSPHGEVKGLNDFIGAHPPVAPVFWSFRIMVGLGMSMIGVAWLTTFFILRKKTLPKFLYLALVVMLPSGWIATLAGWYVTEIGRQPWLVQGILKSAQAVTSVPPNYIAITLVTYATISLLLLAAYAFTIKYLTKKCIVIDELSSGNHPEVSVDPETVGVRQSGVFGLGRSNQ